MLNRMLTFGKNAMIDCEQCELITVTMSLDGAGSAIGNVFDSQFSLWAILKLAW